MTAQEPNHTLNSTVESLPPAKHFRWSYGFIAVVLMIACFALNLSSLLLTQYGYHYKYNELFPNSTSNSSESHTSECTVNKSTEAFHERTAVQQETSRWSLYKTISESVPAVFASMVLGPLSDKYGRKKLLIFNSALILVSYSLNLAAIYFAININYFILTGAIYSVGGGFFGSISIGFAYVSDITDVGKSRTLIITLLEVALGTGGALSGLASGYIIQRFGFFYTSVLICGALATGTIVLIIFLPELHVCPAQHTKSGGRQGINTTFEFYFKKSVRRSSYILGITIFLVAVWSKLGKDQIETLYELNAPFCWSSLKIGFYSAISITCMTLMGMFLFKFLQLFLREDSICIISAISNMAGNTLEAFAFNDITQFLVPVVSIAGLLIIPMMRAILSKMTPPDKQGALFASIAVVEIIGSFSVSVASKAIYIATVGHFRGFTFLVYAAFSVVAMMLLLIYRCLFLKNGFERMTEDDPP